MLKKVSLQKDFFDSYHEVPGEKHTSNEFKREEIG